MSIQGIAQKFADKEYYLVDSLVLEGLSKGDSLLLEGSLKEYYLAKDDTGKINSLSDICENMMHEDWKKFQFIQNKLIQVALKKPINKEEKKVLMNSYSASLNNIGLIFKQEGKIEDALVYYHRSLQILEKLEIGKNLVSSYYNLGAIYHTRGNVALALKFISLSLTTSQEIGDEKGVGNALNNLADVYRDQGKIQKALLFHHKALKIREGIGDKKGISNSLNNIGFVYDGQEDYIKALEHYQKALTLRIELGDKKSIGNTLNNIGSLYDSQRNTSKALEYFEQSLKVQQEIGNKKGIGNALSNIGVVHKRNGDIELAMTYSREALKIFKELGDIFSMASTMKNIGTYEFEMGKIKSAQISADRSLNMAKKIESPENIKRAAYLLSDVYKAQGKGMKALEMHKLYVQMKDSINNEETQKAAIRQQTQYEFEKAQIVKENEAKEEARLEAEETGRRNNLQYSLIFLGILVLFVAILLMGFIKVSPNVAEGLIFFAFLILFEFILVFTEPYLGQYTNGEPMYNLLANSVLALLIFPVHAILEKLLKKRIVKG